MCAAYCSGSTFFSFFQLQLNRKYCSLDLVVLYMYVKTYLHNISKLSLTTFSLFCLFVCFVFFFFKSSYGYCCPCYFILLWMLSYLWLTGYSFHEYIATPSRRIITWFGVFVIIDVPNNCKQYKLLRILDINPSVGDSLTKFQKMSLFTHFVKQ